jgi:hypothetical protein
MRRAIISYASAQFLDNSAVGRAARNSVALREVTQFRAICEPDPQRINSCLDARNVRPIGKLFRIRVATSSNGSMTLLRVRPI